MGFFDVFKSKPLSPLKFLLPEIHPDDFKKCKVGSHVNLFTQPNMNYVIIYAPGSVGGGGRIGGIDGKYGKLIQKHILRNSTNYEAIIIDVSGKSCTIEVKLLSDEEVKILENNQLEAQKEDTKTRLNKEKRLIKPLELKFILKEPINFSLENLQLKIFDKEVYIKNPYEYKVQLVTPSNKVVAETLSQKQQIISLIQAYYSGQTLTIKELKQEKEYIKAIITGE